MILVFTLTLVIFLGVVWILMWVKTPHYQMQREDIILLLQTVLLGQASENDWAIFLSSSFRHSPELELIKERCAVIDESEYSTQANKGYLFTRKGLQQLKEILQELETGAH